MSFLQKYPLIDKPKKKIRKETESVILDSISDQRQILLGATIKRNGKIVSSWNKDGYVTPRVSGLNLFDDGNGGSNTSVVTDYSNYLDDLEAAVKGGDISDIIEAFDKRRTKRDDKLRKSLGK